MRRRRSALCAALSLGVTLTAAGAQPASAQAAADDAQLFSPVPSDPKRKPGFETQMRSDPPGFRLRAYGNPPGAGAGKTGFVSTNASKKKKAPPVAPSPPAPIVVAPPDATLPAIYRVAPPTPPRGSQQTAGRPGDPTGTLRPVKRLAEEDAFAPIGIRSGPITYKPAVEIQTGRDSNPGRISGGNGSWLTQVAPELLIASNWSRHEFTAALKGNYAWYHDLPSYTRGNADLKSNVRLDITRDTRAEFEGRYVHSNDTPGNPNNPTDVASPPTYDRFGGSAALTQSFNRLELRAKGDADRLVYRDATLNDGTTLKLDDRNYNQYGGTLRGSYEWLPGVKPFVEAGMDRRVHDLAVDYGGVRRDSDGKSIKAGSTFELTRKLTGEASVGWLTRTYKDPTLTDLSGLTVDASLVYTATPLTTATLTAKSTVDESSMTGVSGILRRDAGLQLEHSFRRWLIGTAKVGYGTDDYQGIGREDKRYTASVGATYKLSREVQFKGEFRQEWLRSSVPGQDYTASIVLFGLRFQR